MVEDTQISGAPEGNSATRLAKEEAVTPPDVKAEGAPCETGNKPEEVPYVFLGREGVVTGEYYKPNKAEQERQKKRSRVVACILVCFMLLIFATTILRIGQAANSGGG